MQDGPRTDQNGGRVFRIILKRHDAVGDDAGFATTMEGLRIRMLDVFSAKGDGSHAPAWLSSADGLKGHLQSLLGSGVEFEAGGADSSAGSVGLEVFDTGSTDLSIDPSMVLRFIPEFFDIPSQFG